jgi:hypothetical protein
MMRPEDTELTPKMVSEVLALSTYPSVANWTAYGEQQSALCGRCARCDEMLILGAVAVPVEVKAQHLVTRHGYSYDGQTPEEFARSISEL